MVISLLCSSIHIRFKTRTVLFRVKSPGHLTNRMCATPSLSQFFVCMPNFLTNAIQLLTAYHGKMKMESFKLDESFQFTCIRIE